jgi:hypothetical protein
VFSTLKMFFARGMNNKDAVPDVIVSGKSEYISKSYQEAVV